MRIIFSNQFGCHSKSSLMLNFPQLIEVADTERDQALEQGWLVTAEQHHEVWYQCRSTRTKLSLTDYELLDNAHIIEKPNYRALDYIYTEYCKHKHYTKYFEVNEFLDTDIILGYNYEDTLTAWTKLRPYSSQSIESVLFAWDYREPSSHLGIKSLKHEIAWARQQGYKYLYMGPGYEKNSIYKSDVDGFEWWTGSEWSQDIGEYTWLCKRDSKIASYYQVHQAFAILQHARSNP